MKLGRGIRLGAWILVFLNVMMALGAIWGFMRMTPVIKEIIQRNERSLTAGAEMLVCLAISSDNKNKPSNDAQERFTQAFIRANNNVTEKGEDQALAKIRDHYPRAFTGDAQARSTTVDAIMQLLDINREAMVRADLRARQFGNAGAWCVAFMATAVFLIGMIFLKRLKTKLVIPLEEIHAVLKAFKLGEGMRRCTGSGVHGDIRDIFDGVNDLLDRVGPNQLNISPEEEEEAPEAR